MSRAAARGFTMLELLVVVAIVAVGAAAATLSLGSVQADALEREAGRLAALLEAGRARSRTAGVPIVWRAEAAGFVFDGLPPGGEPLPEHWLDASVRVAASEGGGEGGGITLGPDPIIAAQGVTLELGEGGGTLRRIRIATDGLHPFAVEAAP